jgi:molecular chaperone GrpE
MTEKKHAKHEHDVAKKHDVDTPAAEAGPSAAAPEATEPSAPAQPQAGSTETELATLKDRLLRLQADFDNFRKRTQREKAEWSLSANETIVRELIPVLDHFELGLKTSVEHKTEKPVHDGFQMIYEQLLASLKKFGVVPFDVHESGFDPVHHEAVAHIPSAEYPSDEIIAQTRRGWKLGEKLLRPVQVVISSGPGAPRDDDVAPGGGEPPPENSPSDLKASS